MYVSLAGLWTEADAYEQVTFVIRCLRTSLSSLASVSNRRTVYDFDGELGQLDASTLGMPGPCFCWCS